MNRLQLSILVASVCLSSTATRSHAQVGVAPPYAFLREGDNLPLRVYERIGTRTLDRTRASSFLSTRPSVVEVDSSGRIEAVQNGRADVKITYGDVNLYVPVSVLDFIDLGEIVGGGDGTVDSPPRWMGIHAGTGHFGNGHLAAVFNDSPPNPERVDTSQLDYDLIDSVFLMHSETCPVNKRGDMYFFPPQDPWENTWDLILNASEPGSNVEGRLDFGDGHRFVRGIGLHASAGITFDLETLRDYHGEENVRFVSAFAGEGSVDPCGNPPEIAELVNCHIFLLDGRGEVLDASWVGPIKNDAEFVEMEIPEMAMYLTFAVGSAGNTLACDHGAFGNAFLTACSLGSGSCPGTLFLRGDTDADGNRNITDAVRIIQYLFSGSGLNCLSAADANDDGKVDVTDALEVVIYLFLRASPHPAPFLRCGLDPTPDDLSCLAYAFCE